MSSPSPGPLPRAIGLGALLGLVLLVRHGYQFATQNGYEPVGMAMRVLEPELLTRDWYMQAAAQADVRWATFNTLAGIARFTGMEVASGLCILLGAITLGIAFHLLARPLFGPSPLPALTAVLLTDRIANLPGLNRLWQSVLTPSGFAVPLAMLGLAATVAGRPLAAGLACGVAGVYHFQVGFGALVMAGCGFLVSGRGTLPALLRLGAPFAILAGPPIVKLALDLRPLAADPAAVIAVLLYRAPWHYLPVGPGTLPGWGVIGAWLLMFGVLWWPRRQEPAHRAAAGMVAALVAMTIVAVVGSEVVAIPFVIKFQFLRLAPLFAAFGALYLGHALAGLARRALGDRADAAATALVVAAGVVAGAYVLDAGRMIATGGPPGLPGQRLNPSMARTGDPSVNALGTWIAAHTPVDAVFLAPPQIDGFRVRSRRAIVVDFKSVAFSDRALLDWDRRFQDACGTSPAARVPLELVPQAYGGRPLADLRAVARRWGADYVITQRAYPGERALYGAQGWWVYPVDPP